MMSRWSLRLLLLLGLALGTAATLSAQNDTSPLHPPKGAKVALVVFEDLECPDCARAAPIIAEAERTYKIPVVRYDFPLPQHPWAFDAAVMGHYFDSKDAKLGVQFREYIFKNQNAINPATLRMYADKFAKEHNTTLPFVVDPQGKFAAEVRADRAVGNRVGIDHTPTLYVVSDNKRGKPFVEVTDRTQLFQIIDQMKGE